MNLSTAHQYLHRFPGSNMIEDVMIPHTYTDTQKYLLSVVSGCTQASLSEFSEKLESAIKEHSLSETAIRHELLSNPLLLNWLSHLKP